MGGVLGSEVTSLSRGSEYRVQRLETEICCGCTPYLFRYHSTDYNNGHTSSTEIRFLIS